MKRTLLAFFAIVIFTCAPLAAEQIEFRLTGNAGNGLLPGNVTPPTSSDGSGGIGLTGIIFDLDTNFLFIDIGWGSENGYSDLTGEITNLHLHGPTPNPARSRTVKQEPSRSIWLYRRVLTVRRQAEDWMIFTLSPVPM